MIVLLLGVLAASAGGPHADPAACGACHAPAPDGAPVGPPRPSAETCQACHPNADMHPVGVVPSEVAVPDGFPLEDGAVGCRTCHLTPTHAGQAGHPAPYLRGGPFAARQDFCFQCHDAGGFTRQDPHRPGQGDSQCAACHVRHPDAGLPPDAAHLRGGPAGVCRTCHPVAPHAGVSEHLGKRPDGTGVPVDADGAMGCWSCHDVHVAPAPRATQAHPAAEALRAAALAGSWAALPADLRWPGAADPPPATTTSSCDTCHRGIR